MAHKSYGVSSLYVDFREGFKSLCLTLIFTDLRIRNSKEWHTKTSNHMGFPACMLILGKALKVYA